jgi:chromosomal replication initiator protein
MESIWSRAKEVIREQIDPGCFNRWIEPLRFVQEDNGTVVLGCPDGFFKEWVDKYYKETIEEILGSHTKVVLKVFDSPPQEDHPQSKARQMRLDEISPSHLWNYGLNSHFTFDEFVVGPCNEFAYSASMEVARSDSAHITPLVLLADVGLGKSHLSCAIGNHILHHHPHMKVCYTTAEGFFNEMVRSIKAKNLEGFKEKYRTQFDVVVLDGIQYLSGKTSTQIELSHTLDILQNERKKIVLTSKLLPQEIPDMDNALKSRILSGIIADIRPPDYETRFKILRRKARQQGAELPETILEFLAENITGNVRHLEGALMHLLAKASLLKRPIDVNLAAEVVNERVHETAKEKKPSILHIQKCVCRYFKIDLDTLTSKSRRSQSISPARSPCICAGSIRTSP